MKMVLDNKKTLDKIQLAVKQELQIALDNALKTIQSKIKININTEDKASYTDSYKASYKASCKASCDDKKKHIEDLISKTTKFTNINYKNSIDSRRRDEDKHRLDRVMRTIKSWYSEDGYMDIIRGLQQASHFEKLDFIRNMEKAIVERRKAT
tara:strand:+ start:16 stop:474 length:459 start_codon:yes stop_codon:yes gene_type:complete